jgi:hypothetical protein
VLLVLASGLLGVACGAVQFVGGGAWGWCVVSAWLIFLLPAAMCYSRMVGAGNLRAKSVRRGSRHRHSRPNGIKRDGVKRRRRLSPNGWAENAPQPNRTIGRSVQARSTRNVTGLVTERRR